MVMNGKFEEKSTCSDIKRGKILTRLEHAYQFASLGMPVFPIEVGGKKPLTEHGFKDATTDQEQILKWSQKWPNCNWAVATGDVMYG